MNNFIQCILFVILFFFFKVVPDRNSAGVGLPQFQRIPLPGTEFLEEEPLYVNAKQYKRILKRRQARAKLEAEGKIPKSRQVVFTKTFCNLWHGLYKLQIIVVKKKMFNFSSFQNLNSFLFNYLYW